MIKYMQEVKIQYFLYTGGNIVTSNIIILMSVCVSNYSGGRRGRDLMVVGFTTTYAISAYHH